MKRTCKYCGTDISHLKLTANRCKSVECRNAYQRELRAAHKKGRVVEKIQCGICPTWFLPEPSSRKYCSPECAHIASVKRQRKWRNSQRTGEIQQPSACDKQPKVEWDGVVRKEDWNHRKYLAQERRLNSYSHRICLSENCNNRCKGENRYCDECREKQLQIAANENCEGNWMLETSINDGFYARVGV